MTEAKTNKSQMQRMWRTDSRKRLASPKPSKSRQTKRSRALTESNQSEQTLDTFGETSPDIIPYIDRRALVRRHDTLTDWETILSGQIQTMTKCPNELLTLIYSYWRAPYAFWMTTDRTQCRLRIWRRPVMSDGNCGGEEYAPIAEWDWKRGSPVWTSVCGFTQDPHPSIPLVRHQRPARPGKDVVLDCTIVRFDPERQTLSVIANLGPSDQVSQLLATYGHTVVAVGSRAVLWVGGFLSCRLPCSLEGFQYDFQSHCLSKITPSPCALGSTPCAVGIENRYLIAVGIGPECEQCFAYDLDTCEWSRLPDLTCPRWSSGIAVLDSGKCVVVLGGRPAPYNSVHTSVTSQAWDTCGRTIECGTWACSDRDDQNVALQKRWTWRMLQHSQKPHCLSAVIECENVSERLHCLGNDTLAWTRGDNYCFGGAAFGMPSHLVTEIYRPRLVS